MRTKYYFLELVLGLFLISCSLGNKHDKSSDILSDNTNSFGVNTAKPEGNGVTIGGIIKIIKVYPAAIDFQKDTIVTIYGENFDSNLTVTIGGILCTKLNFTSSKQISCFLPKVTGTVVTPAKTVILQITNGTDFASSEMLYLLFDSDGDNVPDSVDNCSNYYNPGQEIDPVTGIVIDCDLDDSDLDGVLDKNDNCVNVYNPEQEQEQDKLVGIACDPHDDDNDGVKYDEDNCPDNFNPDQQDSDGDGIGDACQPEESVDMDQDGIMNWLDNCPEIFNPDQKDSNADGEADACQNSDNDFDGIMDWKDNCGSYNPDQQDSNLNGVGDACDTTEF